MNPAVKRRRSDDLDDTQGDQRLRRTQRGTSETSAMDSSPGPQAPRAPLLAQSDLFDLNAQMPGPSQPVPYYGNYGLDSPPLQPHRSPSTWQPALGLSWRQVEDDFIPDGSLAALAVVDADVLAWHRLLFALPHSSHSYTLFADEQPIASLETPLVQIFAEDNAEAYKLHLNLESNSLHCQFFALNQLEFDFDVFDVAGQDDYDALMGFMQFVYQATAQKVVVGGTSLLYICGDETQGVPWRKISPLALLSSPNPSI